MGLLMMEAMRKSLSEEDNFFPRSREGLALHQNVSSYNAEGYRVM